MKKTALIAAALAAAICGTAVWSQGTRGTDRPGRFRGFRFSTSAMAVMPPPAGMIDRMAEMLQLKSDQVAKLKKIAVAGDKTLEPLRQEAAKASFALRSAILAPKYSAKTVNDLAAKAEKAEAKLVAASINEWTKIRAVLTASQLSELRSTGGAHSWGPGRRPEGSPPAGKR